ncbi:unnamed protein product, partial [Rotaria socialis]
MFATGSYDRNIAVWDMSNK